MPSTSLVSLSSLIDDAKCYALVRQQRWPDGVRCPTCGSATVIRHGRDDTQEQRQRYRCKDCRARFDDLTGTALAGHHQPLRVWVLCPYLMGLNLSNRQIAQELDLGETDVQAMTEQLSYGLPAGARSTRTSRRSWACSSAAAPWSCACSPTCSRRRSGPSPRPRSLKAPSSTPTSTMSTRAWRNGATGTRPSVTPA